MQASARPMQLQPELQSQRLGRTSPDTSSQDAADVRRRRRPGGTTSGSRCATQPSGRRARRRSPRRPQLLLDGMRDGSCWTDPESRTSPARAGRTRRPSGSTSSRTRSRESASATVRRADVQDYVDRLRKKGLSASTIANKLDPIRVVFRRAIKRDEISIDPTDGLELPAVRGRRERIADRTEAATLIAALPMSERAFWATAIYGGLRRGELRALRWIDVELDATTGADPRPPHLGRRRRARSRSRPTPDSASCR